MFFQENEQKRVLERFWSKCDAAYPNVPNEVLKKRLTYCSRIVLAIYNSPASWDAKCTFNIREIGSQFIEQLRIFDFTNLTSLNIIYIQAYSFLCEYDFFVGAGHQLSVQMQSLPMEIEDDIHGMDIVMKSQMLRVAYLMPVTLAKEYLNHPNINAFKEFDDKKRQVEVLKGTWDDEIQVKENKVNELKDKLEQYKVAFNFVGLYKGFSELANEKRSEAKTIFHSLLAMGD